MADRRIVAHLLRRATFGPTAREVDAAEAGGPAATLARLLTPGVPDAGAAAAPVPRLGPDPYAGLTRASTREERQRANQRRREQVQELTRWWFGRMVAAEHQLTEKMVFFWHGHWATSVRKVRSAPLMLGQLQTFRRAGRGDFAGLVKAMLRDPALILWLDGQRNTRRAPNENLARELMELFTLGIGAYTEDDIRAGARALTGWTVDRRTGTVSLVRNRHDPGMKTILGRTAAFGADSYADLLVRQPAHPVFLARRLWFRFGSGLPMPADTERRLVAAYGPGRDVDGLLRALFREVAFGSTGGQLVKQPVEWAVGAMRQLGVDPARLSGERQRALLGGLAGLGQIPLRPPSVGGWPAGAAWLTTSSTQARMRLATGLAAWADPAVLDSLGAAAVDARLAALARILVVDAWTDRTRAALAQASGDPHRLLAVGLASPEYTVC
jgi:uncharacterized protein (DUF1800 family)